jgi:hypothetical protein
MQFEMEKQKNFFSRPLVSRWVFNLSVLSLIYWLVVSGLTYKVYKFPVVGAMYELLWLPMLLLLFLLPVAGILIFISGGSKVRAIFSLLIMLAVFFLVRNSMPV